MHQILNTLYVMTEGAMLRLDHDTLKVKVDRKVKLQVPLLHLGAIYCFGRVMPSVGLIHRCALDGRAIVFFDFAGRFRARINGPVTGNVLLRRDQYAAAADPARCVAVARSMVAGKIQNARQVLLRAARETERDEDGGQLDAAARRLAGMLPAVEPARDPRCTAGSRGPGGGRLFRGLQPHGPGGPGVVCHLWPHPPSAPRPHQRPALVPIRSVGQRLCFRGRRAWAWIRRWASCTACALGRPALALDLMEELRPLLADRLALTLINRRQVARDDFEERPGGAFAPQGRAPQGRGCGLPEAEAGRAATPGAGPEDAAGLRGPHPGPPAGPAPARRSGRLPPLPIQMRSRAWTVLIFWSPTTSPRKPPRAAAASGTWPQSA